MYKLSKKSQGAKLWIRAQKTIAGGNMLLTKHPYRFLKEYWPTYFNKTKGCKVWDLNQNKFLDFSYMGVGTNSLGYSRKEIDQEVVKKIKLGNMSTLNSPEEVLLSEQLINLNPWADKVRFTRSGGEANSVAVRIARSYKKKDKILICGYHGWHDWYLSTNLQSKNNLNGNILAGLDPNGVPKALRNTTFAFKYNDIDQFNDLINKYDGEIAAVKMEVVRNIYPTDNFIQKVRSITKKKRIVLIFDECTSGFREAYGGIYKKYNVIPDMIIYGKALGNGYAINAVLGKGKIMNSIESTFISSTFWTERIGYVAGLSTLKIMKKEKSWKKITHNGNKIRKIWSKVFKKCNFNYQIQGIPALSNFYFEDQNNQKFINFICEEMLKKGFLANNVFYASTAHNDAYINKYAKAFEETCLLLKNNIELNMFNSEIKKTTFINKRIGRLN